MLEEPGRSFTRQSPTTRTWAREQGQKWIHPSTHSANRHGAHCVLSRHRAGAGAGGVFRVGPGLPNGNLQAPTLHCHPQPPPVPWRACHSPRTGPRSRGKFQQYVDQSHLPGAHVLEAETGLRLAGNWASSCPEKPEDRGFQRAVQATVKGLLCAGILQESFRVSPTTMLGGGTSKPHGTDENASRVRQVNAQLLSLALLSDLCWWPPMSAKASVPIGHALLSPQGS